MKTFNCVQPKCNKKATNYCGHVTLLVNGKKHKVTAGLCNEHAERLRYGRNDVWTNGKKWRKKNGLTRYNKRINPVTMIPYQIQHP